MRRFLPVCLVCVLCLGVCAAQEPLSPASAPASGPPTANGLNSLQGLKVATVRINSQVEHAEWLEPLLPQKANQPLDKYKVRQSVQVLYNTGKFSEIQVEAQRTPQGEVVLTFDGRENYFFGSIRVEGAPGPPTEPQLVSATKLGLGEQFTEEKIKNAIEGMQRTLQEHGYFQASIQPFYEWDSHHQQVKILFVITRGSRARIGAIKVTGTPENTPEQIASIAKLHPGDHVTAGHLTRGLQRLRKRYQKKGRLEAQVTLTQRAYHPENNTLDYTFDITSGPVVEVKVEGAKIRSGVIKRYVPVFEENAVDEDLLNEGARNLRDYLQSQGFFDAEVTYTLRQIPEQNRQDVVFKVEKNGRHQLVGVLLQGNKYFNREDIRERMQIQPAGGLLLHGVFSQAMLAHDIQAIQVLYLENGFLQVKVTPTVDDNYGGKTGHILVTLHIDEGPQTTVGKLTIEGNQVLSDADIHNLISASEGQPYSDSTLINDQTEVMNAYFNRGFPQARVEYSAQRESNDPTKIDIRYKITEGQEIFVDNVLISGLHFTRPFIVNREMQIQTGDPLGQSGMLDSQRRLYDMGIFNEVNMAVQNPEGDSSHKSVNFQLTEAKRYTFNYGGGLEVQTGQPSGTSNPQGSTGVSPRVSFDITRLNFRGLDHTITMKTRYGNLEKLGLLGYEVPRFFGSQQFALDFTAFYEQTNDVKTFTAKRLEGSVQVKENPNRATSLLYRFIFRRVSTDNLVIDPNLVPLFSQPVRVGLPEFIFLRDTRDNPIESHKGSFTTFDIGVASGIFGSQANFTRIVAQNSTYYQFHKRRWVFARSTRIGIEEPFGNTSAAIAAPGPGAPPPESFIPLPERFLTGGSTSHRGFGINQAGPRDLATGFPLGGEAMFINNFELRTPPLPFPFVGNNLSAVVFHDMGNAFTTPIDMVHGLLKFSQPNRSSCLNPTAQSCNFNYNSNAVGGGIRYRTPIGPVSFDFGYNLNPPAFPIGSPTQPAPPAPPVAPFSEVLRHFNFFFNIGQTF